MRTEVEIIAAMDENRLIGRGAQIPWHLSEDLKHFKAITQGHTVIMGRKTFLSIGRPLPKRRNLVISSQLQAVPGIEIFSDLKQALAAAQGQKTFIIGGAQLYAAALPLASVLHLTRIKAAFTGDVYFPPFEHLGFKLQKSSPVMHSQEENFDYVFETWAAAGTI